MWVKLFAELPGGEGYVWGRARVLQGVESARLYQGIASARPVEKCRFVSGHRFTMPVEKCQFVSGHRFSDAVSDLLRLAPLGAEAPEPSRPTGFKQNARLCKLTEPR
jgi:hypothetical protein